VSRRYDPRRKIRGPRPEALRSADAAAPRAVRTAVGLTVVSLVDLAVDDPRWDAALPVLQELRPHLDRQSLHDVYTEGHPQGYRFLAAFDDDDGRCLGVAGWRVVATAVAGRKLYVDDLVTTVAARGGGVGRALLGELERRARAAGCTVLDLDSGVQRHDAHRFYLRERMHIGSHHFSKRLPEPADPPTRR
jgi:GNAT superfamily N-acetyltransferase